MSSDLAPPPDGLTDTSPKGLKDQINEHAKEHGYAVRIQRTILDKKGEKRKSWFFCDRGGKETRPRGQKRLHSTSQIINCPFKATANRDRFTGVWCLVVLNASHNHTGTKKVAHRAHRAAAMTPDVRDIIRRQTVAGDTPAQIITTLHQTYDEDDPVFKPEDIHNERARIKRVSLGPLTPTQAMLQWLHKGDWYVKYLKDHKERITHLFFSRSSCHKILKLNWEVLIMDCTYKTNKYKIPLFVITGTTALNTSFYVAFCFLEREEEQDYKWALQQLRDMLIFLDIPDPVVNISDREAALILALYSVFPNARHMLCIWHINKDVLSNCKSKLATKEDWEEFQASWQRVVYASTIAEFTEAWDTLQDVYDDYDPLICAYLARYWINPYKRKFVKAYTNSILHFMNTASSKAESGHAGLKRELKFSTGDLKVVVEKIRLLLSRQKSNYEGAFETAKMRTPYELRIPVLRDVVAHVTPFALKLVVKQHEKLASGVLDACTNVFTTTSGLPCAHKIRDRIQQGAGVLRLHDIHAHWRFEKPASYLTRAHVNELEDDDQLDPLLTVQEPAVAHTKGRPRGPRELPTRAELAAQRSTQRDPSRFEAVEQYLSQRSSQTPLSRVNSPRRPGGASGGVRGGSTSIPTRGGRGPAITASQVAQQEEDEIQDIFFADAFMTPTSDEGEAPAATPRGRGTGRGLLALPPRRRGAGAAAPAAIPPPGLPVSTATATPIGRPAGRGYGTTTTPQARGNYGGYGPVYDPTAW